MTQDEIEFEKLSDAELRLKLSVTFNALGGLRKSSQEFRRATATAKTIERVLCRRAESPKP